MLCSQISCHTHPYIFKLSHTSPPTTMDNDTSKHVSFTKEKQKMSGKVSFTKEKQKMSRKVSFKKEKQKMSVLFPGQLIGGRKAFYFFFLLPDLRFLPPFSHVFNSTTRCLLCTHSLVSLSLSLSLSLFLSLSVYKDILILIFLPHPFPTVSHSCTFSKQTLPASHLSVVSRITYKKQTLYSIPSFLLPPHKEFLKISHTSLLFSSPA